MKYSDALLERCHVCKGKEHKIYDELIGESQDTSDRERFAEVEKIEKMYKKFTFGIGTKIFLWYAKSEDRLIWNG